MTYVSENSRQQYAGNGVATEFSTGFKFQDNNQVAAMVSIPLVGGGYEENKLVEGVDYTLVGAGNTQGTLTFPKAGSVYHVLAIGEHITIYPNPPIRQDRVFNNVKGLDLAEIEKALDLLTMIAASLADGISRALVYSPGATAEEIGTPQEYLQNVQTARAEAITAAEAAEAAKVAAVAAAANVPPDLAEQLLSIVASTNALSGQIGTLQAQMAQAGRAAKLLLHGTAGGM